MRKDSEAGATAINFNAFTTHKGRDHQRKPVLYQECISTRETKVSSKFQSDLSSQLFHNRSLKNKMMNSYFLIVTCIPQQSVQV